MLQNTLIYSGRCVGRAQILASPLRSNFNSIPLKQFYQEVSGIPSARQRKFCSFSTATHLRFLPNCFLSRLSCPIPANVCLILKLCGWARRRKGKECYDRFASTFVHSRIL